MSGLSEERTSSTLLAAAREVGVTLTPIFQGRTLRLSSSCRGSGDQPGLLGSRARL